MFKTLAELRSERGLTQRALAAELNKCQDIFSFSPTAIALYELGTRTPRLNKAKVLADYFGVSLEAISFGPCACTLKALRPTGTEG